MGKDKSLTKEKDVVAELQEAMEKDRMFFISYECDDKEQDRMAVCWDIQGDLFIQAVASVIVDFVNSSEDTKYMDRVKMVNEIYRLVQDEISEVKKDYE